MGEYRKLTAPPLKKLICKEEIACPEETGFSKLKGQLYYLQGSHMVEVVVYPTRTKTNRCPSLSTERLVPWSDSKDRAGMKLHLHGVLQHVLLDIVTRAWPERDIYLGRCNITGKNDSLFLSTVCSTCICPYCEISDG